MEPIDPFTYQKQTSVITIKHLFEKYRDEEYLLNKLSNYVVTQLPKFMDNHKISQEENVLRKTKLTAETTKFENEYLAHNRLFYLPSSDTFFKYDGYNYTTYTEDNICHEILSTISNERILMSHKEKVKNNIIKKIKDNSLFKTIPESNTIQTIINLFYPAIFNTKDKAKYFLTIIGNNLLHVDQHFIHLITPKAKHFLKEITHFSYLYTSINPTTTFKYKFHDQEYKNIRLININTITNSSSNCLTNSNMINIISVACYYSNRYTNSDKFLTSHCDFSLSSYSFFLKNNTSKEIVDLFCSYYIEKCEDTSSNDLPKFNIPWKYMIYLWKSFLDEKKFPNILFNNNLKSLLKDQFTYNETRDSFEGITSKYLPKIAAFIEFWDNQIQDCEDEEIEIGEINTLFKTGMGIFNHKSIGNHCNDEQLLNIINYYYPDTEIHDGKYLMNLSCKLWDKHNDITTFVTCYKDSVDNFSVHTAYEEYVKSQPTFVASKRYFMDKCHLHINNN
jgi:hypothetical protein